MMKKFTALFSGDDDKSYFKEVDPGVESEQPLGSYSKVYSSTGMIFRTFKAGLKYDWHNPPQPQYIIYLEGEVEVQASGGETRVFKPGDVLYANDMKGKGHISKTLIEGRSIIIKADKPLQEQDGCETNVELKM